MHEKKKDNKYICKITLHTLILCCKRNINLFIKYN